MNDNAKIFHFLNKLTYTISKINYGKATMFVHSGVEIYIHIDFLTLNMRSCNLQ